MHDAHRVCLRTRRLVERQGKCAARGPLYPDRSAKPRASADLTRKTGRKEIERKCPALASRKQFFQCRIVTPSRRFAGKPFRQQNGLARRYLTDDTRPTATGLDRMCDRFRVLGLRIGNHNLVK